MDLKRGSGILAHITSLPSVYGIGDLGCSSLKFIDFLAASSQSYWQFLPLGPTSQFYYHSPYTSCSAFAGNPLLISPDGLVKDGFLSQDDLVDQRPIFSDYLVEFSKVIEFKIKLFERAFTIFKKRQRKSLEKFNLFCESQKEWLNDWALFASLKEENKGQAWYDWSRSIAKRNKVDIKKSFTILSERVLFHKFLQFCFFSQLNEVLKYAREKKIVLIGDMPIYTSPDSSDVWIHQDFFELDKDTLKPTFVAGVPPDYFSNTGQVWENPVYRWKNDDGHENSQLYAWWKERFRHILKTVDIVRVDHFRGFESYWKIAAKEETAIDGQWIKGPGAPFLEKLMTDLGDLPIIAEDLGIITPEVEKLRDAMNFPGMKVLQFAFDSDEKNCYLPYNYDRTNFIVYTGTHDNSTTVGWYFDEKVPQRSKERALRYANSCCASQIHWDFIRMAYSSISKVAVIPLQDVLGFGDDCRMNIPGTKKKDNWVWRCPSWNLTDDLCRRLADETQFYGR